MLGKFILKGTETTSYWFRRQGDAADFLCEVFAMQIGSNFEFEIEVYTKNTEETDAQATTPVATITINSAPAAYPHVYSADATGLKELVRYKFKVSGDVSGDYAHFRMLDPVWQRN